MELFEYLQNDIKRGNCDSNHFHIVLNCDLEKNIEIQDQNCKVLGTFMHEYLHYMQHLISLRGLTTVSAYNRFFIELLRFLEKNKNIEIPINIKEISKGFDDFLTSFGKIKGHNENVALTISEADVTKEYIQKAKQEKKAVQVDIYDFEAEEVESFNFGYYCIIESMAHLFQSYYDKETEHPNIPYHAVQIVVKKIYPEIAEDKKMLISICLCSLMDYNPGAFFFEVIEFAKKNPHLNGLDLYLHFLKKFPVRYQGKLKSIKELYLLFLNDLENSLNIISNNQLDYYKPVLEHCRKEMSEDKNLLLDFLYNEDITSKEFIILLLNFYGIPFIDANNMVLIPENISMDLICIKRVELVLKRLRPSKNENRTLNHKCPLIERCLQSIEDNTINEDMKPPMNEYCNMRQWNNNGKNCMAGSAFRSLKLHEKIYTINEY